MPARRAALGLCALLALAAAPATAQDRDRPAGGRPRAGHGAGWADPSDVLSAEIAYARLAREKGQWSASRSTAARGAWIAAPDAVGADAFLKGRKDPARIRQWQPHAVWIACDGSYGATTGAWQEDSAFGWFTTIWQRQPKDGYRWVLAASGPLKQPLAAPDFLTARVADCPARGHRDDQHGADKQPRREARAAVADYRSWHSDDGTLAWELGGGEGTGPRMTVRMAKGGQMVPLPVGPAPAP